MLQKSRAVAGRITAKFKLNIASVLIAVLMLSACGDDDVVVVYQARKVDPATWGFGHEWIVKNPTIYRIGESSVVTKVGSFVEKYNDCAILTVDDWKCTYPDKSGSFGFRDGEFWRYPNDGWEDIKTISRFQYNVISCKWNLDSDAPLQWIACPLVWFWPADSL